MNEWMNGRMNKWIPGLDWMDGDNSTTGQALAASFSSAERLELAEIDKEYR